MNSSFFGRLRIFFGERFPVVLSFVATLVGTVSLYLVWCAITPGAALILNKSIYLAIISFFALTLILRLCDEIKDKEVDAKLFPERCLPKGLVLYEDIHKLLLIIGWIWVPINFIFGGAPIIFTILIFYTYLFYKYFFLPEIISNNLILALITHNPLMFVGSFYILALFSVEQGLDVYSIENFFLALAFWMPSLGWETARKIRAPKDETQYITYSKIMGPVGATALPLGAFLTQLIAFSFVAHHLHYGMYFILGTMTLFVLYFTVFLFFMLKQTRKLANILQQTTEAYILFVSVLIIVISIAELAK
jgi:4-hydroxybenzoate polyprenyltransferase